jgi:hypothetical protein
VLLKVFLYFFEKDLGEFFVIIILREMVSKNSQKFSEKFYCEKCDYTSLRKSDYNKHLQSKKHNDNNDNIDDNKKLSYNCDCGKKYNFLSGLSRHKKLCNGNKKDSIIISDNKDEMKDLVFKLINENQDLKNTLLKENFELRNQLKEQSQQNTELQQQISELIPKVGNNNNNNIKQKFNINVFLNEKCKDALSMDEFINKIEVSMKNLLTTKEKGQTHGISNIIIENMNKLSLYERPLHCTDKKRETLYVKNNEWEKDDNKEHINKALKKVESKQLKNLNVWLEEHPNYMNNPSEQEEFAKLMSECGKSVEDGREKIIKKLCDNVYLEKTE